MLLSVMILLHDKLPCSENFFRFYKNFDKYKEDTLAHGAKSPKSSEDGSPRSPIRSIAMPQYDLSLSPVS